jgi:hypothetical protein
MKITPIKCINCVFFVNDKHQPDKGFCQRFPPIIHNENENILAVYPKVHEEWWCGEFKEKGHLRHHLSQDLE